MSTGTISSATRSTHVTDSKNWRNQNPASVTAKNFVKFAGDVGSDDVEDGGDRRERDDRRCEPARGERLPYGKEEPGQRERRRDQDERDERDLPPQREVRQVGGDRVVGRERAEKP